MVKPGTFGKGNGNTGLVLKLPPARTGMTYFSSPHVCGGGGGGGGGGGDSTCTMYACDH